MSFTAAAVAAVGAYLAVLAFLGLRAKAARKTESLADFYLAGRNLGGVVLLFTLYATQYSGNTLVGYPGEAYRVGFAWVMSVGFMLAIVVAYLVMAPRLRAASARHRFVTPADWLDHRFRSPRLTLAATALMTAAIANYLLAQLMAMGHVVAGLSGGAVPYAAGVLVLAAAILGYELLGGLRAVAWTDCLQGILLVVGLFGLLAASFFTGVGPPEAAAWILENEPQKAARPGGAVLAGWASTVLLIGFSGAVYPQAIQRIFAAASTAALRRALSVLAFLPFLTTLPVFFVGILALPRLGGLSGVAADQVLPALLSGWAEESGWMFGLGVVTVVGVVAAIMSTADSVLLTLSSMLAKDFAAPLLRRRGRAPEEARVTRIGKIAAISVMAVLAAVALTPRISLWGLLELKMDLLVQAAPAFFLGLTWRRFRADAAFWGLLAGTALAVGLILAGHGRISGIHAGLLGAALNASVAVVWSWARNRADDGRPGPDSPR